MKPVFSVIFLAGGLVLSGFTALAQTGALPASPTRAETWQQIRSALDDKDWTIAWPLLERLATGGDSDAAYQLAKMLDQGLGARKDKPKAFIWYHKAAEKRNIAAMRQVAVRYLNGDGTDRNHDMAAFWYFAAAQTGDPEAAWSLARFYESGIGVTQNIPVALGWYSLAAQKGWQPALDRLAEIVSRQKRLDKLPQAATRDALADAAPQLPALTGMPAATEISPRPAPASVPAAKASSGQPQALRPRNTPRPAPDIFTNRENSPRQEKPPAAPAPPTESPGPAFSLILDDPGSPGDE